MLPPHLVDLWHEATGFLGHLLCHLDEPKTKGKIKTVDKKEESVR